MEEIDLDAFERENVKNTYGRMNCGCDCKNCPNRSGKSIKALMVGNNQWICLDRKKSE